MISLRRYLRYKLKSLRSRLLRRLLGPNAVGIVWRTWNGELSLPPGDMVIARTLARQGAWDRASIEHLLTLIDGNSRVLVVGAHVGSVVVPLAARAREVVAYEANPANFEHLQLNLRINGCHNVDARNRAASNAPGRLKMLANTTNTGSSKLRPAHLSYAYVYDAPPEIEVPAVVLDDDITDHGFDLVVMDIEGSECLAMQGMRSILQRCRALQIEYLPQLMHDVAGADDAQFPSMIASQFDTAHIAEDRQRFGRDGFGQLLARAREVGGADLVFTKA